jgi:hypothetical protein
MPARLAAPLVVLAAAALFAVAAPAGALAVQLPHELVARLQADRDTAQGALDRDRGRLARAALAQRAASAAAARLEVRAGVLGDAAALLGTTLPPELAADVDDDRTAAAEALDDADATLDAVTRTTSAAQGRALDADRRLRALQRASATEEAGGGSGGSWRFGSGGPAVSADTIDRYLRSKGSPLAGQGAAFVKAGVREQVDPRLVVAIAGAESYFGVITCASHNAWGWGCPSSPFAFASWADAIDAVTHGLREDYVDSGLTSVGEIHLRYAPPAAANDPDGLNYGWADNVARFLVEQGGDPQAIAGVRTSSR